MTISQDSLLRSERRIGGKTRLELQKAENKVNYDVIVIGAGLLGCFTARALAKYNLSAAVLEAEDDVCTGISKANTGIIYSGIDNKPGTLKAELTVASCENFETLSKELDFSFRRCGSLMLSFGGEADKALKWKLNRGKENGVKDVKLLSKKEVLEIEPEVSETVSSALYVPSTGTVNPWEVGIAAYENARANGIPFFFGERVIKIEREVGGCRTDCLSKSISPVITEKTGGFRIETEKTVYHAKALINCAGLSSDVIREMTETPLLRLFPTGADYLVLDTTVGDRIHHILFHETEEKGKGVTIVPTVNGNLLVGPTEREELPNMATDANGLNELKKLCKIAVPDLPLEVIRTFGSKRPNPFYVTQVPNELRCAEDIWVPEKKSISNFMILEEDGLFSFIGIKTPGLTCAEALGRHITEKVKTFLGGCSENPDYDPIRKGSKRTADLNFEERSELVNDDADFGQVICRCRGITKGEVLDAIRRGARTVEEIKFRAETGMGRCQGSFCTEKIRELLKETQSSTDQGYIRSDLKTTVDSQIPYQYKDTKETDMQIASPNKASQESGGNKTGNAKIKSFRYDIVIIGGGAAGLAAAVEAAKISEFRILLLEREGSLGGILKQCVHEGFGVHQFGKSYTGREYAKLYTEQIKDLPVEIKTGTTVLSIGNKIEDAAEYTGVLGSGDKREDAAEYSLGSGDKREDAVEYSDVLGSGDKREDAAEYSDVLGSGDKKVVTAVNAEHGVFRVFAGAIILAMGCREVSAGQLMLAGTRPEGIITAGRLQYMINIEGLVPGKEAVILGSGDVGLIMARQMTQVGIHVQGVYEKKTASAALPGNIEQCLNAYRIPLYLSSTIKEVYGKKKVEGVLVISVDEKGNPIAGTEKKIPCDLLIIAAGLIPENELTRAAGIEIDPATKGPITDSNLMTSQEGIFAAGNVWKVMSLVDAVAKTGEAAARNAVAYLSETGA